MDVTRKESTSNLPKIEHLNPHAHVRIVYCYDIT